ncbi:hypothetical protein ACHAWU_000421 [Discostella pseudostelligera]|uniref:Indole-3-glycerol phosphate synthase n=1 Tax=Discostella pseudostelligera TaxID=259834 RepID=A0ABD3M1A1_9STRA
MDRPQYSDEQLRTALNNFYHGGTAATADGAPSSIDACCNHIYGYNNPNHELSMLQKITATTILDYESKLLNQDQPPPSIDELLQQAKIFHDTHGPIVPFQQIIQDCTPSMALAAEFKRASPSKGDIASHPLDAGEQACLYYGAGACVISVLTEGRWFKGSLDDLRSARLQTTAAANANVSSSSYHRRPAILRKDFITSPYQIAEAAAYGADTILLIVATTPSHILRELITFARETCHMEPLVEVHAIVELDVALEAGARVIGVNNRNLHTFQLDLGQTEKIAMELTKRGLSFHHDDNSSTTSSGGDSHRISLCALSGMSSAQDVDRYRKVGVGMCLIGESLMRASDPPLAIRGLCLDPKDYEGLYSLNGGGGGGSGAYTGGTKIIKVCGITNPTDALVACRAGANLIGVIFAEKSKRKVSIDQATEIVNAVRKFGERSDRVAIQLEEEANTSALSTLIRKARALEQASRVPLVVGVFQNQPLDAIKDIVEQCGLDMVQLHGSEGMAAANSKNFGVPALRVVDIELGCHAGGEGEKQILSSSDKASAILNKVTSDPMAILLDTSIKGEASGGGTGMTFDWTIAEAMQNMGVPVIIAGGLTPENIASAVGNVRPWGVDVAGGVEVIASPGVKDHEKVEQFVGGAKLAAVEASKGF